MLIRSRHSTVSLLYLPRINEHQFLINIEMNMYNVELPKANKNKIVLSEIISTNCAYVKNPIHFGDKMLQFPTHLLLQIWKLVR